MMSYRYRDVAWGLMVLMIAPCTNAGPDFFEDMVTEAGSSISTAQSTTGGVGVLNKIHGTLGGPSAGPMPADFEDLFLINIVDPIAFTATTLGPNGMAEFDTQLWLFDAMGHGVVGNDNFALPATGSTLLPMPTDGAPGLVAPGLYYLGISGFNNVPLSAGGEIFDFVALQEISGPDGIGGMEPLDSWLGEGGFGDYVIYLEGVEFIPAPGALAVCLVGAVATTRRRRRH